MEKTVNLEEILKVELFDLYPFLQDGVKEKILKAMRVACESSLDLGAEKAKVKSVCPDDYMSGYETIVDKQTILNVKKQIVDSEEKLEEKSKFNKGELVEFTLEGIEAGELLIASIPKKSFELNTTYVIKDIGLYTDGYHILVVGSSQFVHERYFKKLKYTIDGNEI